MSTVQDKMYVSAEKQAGVISAVRPPSGGASGANQQKAAGKSNGMGADIPKEDLMHLCMKMNKRMNVLESSVKKLTGRSKSESKIE